MSPELEQAIRERIELGHSKDQIAAELHEAGYDTQTIETVYTTVERSVSGEEPVLPDATAPIKRSSELIVLSWVAVTNRLDVVALLALPSILLVGLGYCNTGTGQMMGLTEGIVAVIATIALMVVMALLQAAALHTAVAATLRETTPTIAESFAWARAHFMAWLWLVILMSLVVVGGVVLFIIPGIIALVYIFVAQYAFVHENVTGMNALQRSRVLIIGHVFSVVWRVIAMMLFIIILYIPIGFVYGLAEILPNGSTYVMSLLAVLEAVLSGFIGLFTMFYGAHLYRELLGQPASGVQPTVWYNIYAGLGLVSFVALFGMIGYSISVADEAALQELIDAAQVAPTEFQLEQASEQAATEAELEALRQDVISDIESN